MSVAAAHEPRPPTGSTSSLPHAEINWDRLDKTKFFVVGTGLFSGVTLMLYPFSVIKTRLQVADASAGRVTAVNTIRSIAAQEGVKGFYRGFGTVISGTIPARCLYLSTLEMTKAKVLSSTTQMGFPETTSVGLAAGAGGLCASLASQTVVVPIDVVSSRMIAQGAAGARTQYKGGLDAFRTILGTEGVRGLYRGFGMSIITYAPSSATWWATYGMAERTYWRLLGYGRDGTQPSPPPPLLVVGVQALGGTTAGGVAALVTTPLDTVKTRIQVLESKVGERPTVRQTIRTLVAEEGMAGFYKGLGPRWASMALWGTCMITVYEYLSENGTLGWNCNGDGDCENGV